MEKFTPHPWRFDEGTTFADEFVCLISQSDEAPYTDGYSDIAQTCSGDKKETQLANAHLIAAAPEMYKHIKQDIEILKRQCKNYVIGSYELKSLHLRIESKQKLLAKARGEV